MRARDDGTTDTEDSQIFSEKRRMKLDTTEPFE